MPDSNAQHQPEDLSHVADYLKAVARKLPYYLREDTLTKQVVIVFPTRKAHHGGIMVWDSVNDYREFSDDGMARFGPVKTLKLKAPTVQSAIRVPGDTPAYRKIRSEV